jgi:2-methylisocitrate lyase-like PEP mutase family enzyme
MTELDAKQKTAVDEFRALHESGCFVLPNPWDRGSAIYLEQLGFKALATTSAGFAFSRGLADSVTAVPRDLMLNHIADIVDSTSLPVNADFQTGYAHEPEGVAASVALCVATGVAGLSIEDASGNETDPLYDFDLAVERIKAARAAIDGTKTSVVLTARCEAWLVEVSDALPVVLKRLTAFAEAGADCLYAPGASNPEDIAAIVKAVSPKPVNVLVSRFNSELTLAQLTDLDVRRISVGSALSSVAWNAFMQAALEIRNNGTFENLKQATVFAELNELFSK